MGLLILQVLKWILWIILFLVLFVLVILSLILLVSIRYRGEVEYKEEKPCIQGRISWLLSFISLTFVYQDQIKMKLKILGISFYDSDKPKKKKPRKKRNSKLKEEKKKSALKKAKEANTDRKQDVSKAEPEEQSFGDKKKDASTAASTTPPKIFKPSLMDRIKGIWKKLTGFKEVILRLTERIKSIWQGCKDKKELFHYYYGLWKREETQATWKRGKSKFGKMAKAVGPKKWLLIGNIGFEDPATTGQMMAAFGIAYPFIGNHIQINPDFEQQVMELKGFFKGRIRLGGLLYQLISLLVNRDCIAFIKLVFKEIMNNQNDKDSSMQEVADDRQ